MSRRFSLPTNEILLDSPDSPPSTPTALSNGFRRPSPGPTPHETAPQALPSAASTSPDRLHRGMGSGEDPLEGNPGGRDPTGFPLFTPTRTSRRPHHTAPLMVQEDSPVSPVRHMPREGMAKHHADVGSGHTERVFPGGASSPDRDRGSRRVGAAFPPSPAAASLGSGWTRSQESPTGAGHLLPRTTRGHRAGVAPPSLFSQLEDEQQGTVGDAPPRDRKRLPAASGVQPADVNTNHLHLRNPHCSGSASREGLETPPGRSENSIAIDGGGKGDPFHSAVDGTASPSSQRPGVDSLWDSLLNPQETMMNLPSAMSSRGTRSTVAGREFEGISASRILELSWSSTAPVNAVGGPSCHPASWGPHSALTTAGLPTPSEEGPSRATTTPFSRATKGNPTMPPAPLHQQQLWPSQSAPAQGTAFPEPRAQPPQSQECSSKEYFPTSFSILGDRRGENTTANGAAMPLLWSTDATASRLHTVPPNASGGWQSSSSLKEGAAFPLQNDPHGAPQPPAAAVEGRPNILPSPFSSRMGVGAQARPPPLSGRATLQNGANSYIPYLYPYGALGAQWSDDWFKSLGVDSSPPCEFYVGVPQHRAVWCLIVISLLGVVPFLSSTSWLSLVLGAGVTYLSHFVGYEWPTIGVLVGTAVTFVVSALYATVICAPGTGVGSEFGPFFLSMAFALQVLCIVFFLTLHFQWFQERFPERACLLERAVVAVTPLASLPPLTSMLIAIVGASYAPLCFLVMMAILHQIFYTPVYSSFMYVEQRVVKPLSKAEEKAGKTSPDNPNGGSISGNPFLLSNSGDDDEPAYEKVPQQLNERFESIFFTIVGLFALPVLFYNVMQSDWIEGFWLHGVQSMVFCLISAGYLCATPSSSLWFLAPEQAPPSNNTAATATGTPWGPATMKIPTPLQSSSGSSNPPLRSSHALSSNAGGSNNAMSSGIVHRGVNAPPQLQPQQQPMQWQQRQRQESELEEIVYLLRQLHYDPLGLQEVVSKFRKRVLYSVVAVLCPWVSYQAVHSSYGYLFRGIPYPYSIIAMTVGLFSFALGLLETHALLQESDEVQETALLRQAAEAEDMEKRREHLLRQQFVPPPPRPEDPLEPEKREGDAQPPSFPTVVRPLPAPVRETKQKTTANVAVGGLSLRAQRQCLLQKRREKMNEMRKAEEKRLPAVVAILFAMVLLGVLLSMPGLMILVMTLGVYNMNLFLLDLDMHHLVVFIISSSWMLLWWMYSMFSFVFSELEVYGEPLTVYTPTIALNVLFCYILGCLSFGFSFKNKRALHWLLLLLSMRLEWVEHVLISQQEDGVYPGVLVFLTSALGIITVIKLQKHKILEKKSAFTVASSFVAKAFLYVVERSSLNYLEDLDEMKYRSMIMVLERQVGWFAAFTMGYIVLEMESRIQETKRSSVVQVSHYTHWYFIAYAFSAFCLTLVTSRTVQRATYEFVTQSYIAFRELPYVAPGMNGVTFYALTAPMYYRHCSHYLFLRTSSFLQKLSVLIGVTGLLFLFVQPTRIFEDRGSGIDQTYDCFFYGRIHLVIGLLVLCLTRLVPLHTFRMLLRVIVWVGLSGELGYGLTATALPVPTLVLVLCVTVSFFFTFMLLDLAHYRLFDEEVVEGLPWESVEGGAGDESPRASLSSISVHSARHPDTKMEQRPINKITTQGFSLVVVYVLMLVSITLGIMSLDFNSVHMVLDLTSAASASSLTAKESVLIIQKQARLHLLALASVVNLFIAVVLKCRIHGADLFPGALPLFHRRSNRTHPSSAARGRARDSNSPPNTDSTNKNKESASAPLFSGSAALHTTAGVGSPLVLDDAMSGVHTRLSVQSAMGYTEASPLFPLPTDLFGVRRSSSEQGGVFSPVPGGGAAAVVPVLLTRASSHHRIGGAAIRDSPSTYTLKQLCNVSCVLSVLGMSILNVLTNQSEPLIFTLLSPLLLLLEKDARLLRFFGVANLRYLPPVLWCFGWLWWCGFQQTYTTGRHLTPATSAASGVVLTGVRRYVLEHFAMLSPTIPAQVSIIRGVFCREERNTEGVKGRQSGLSRRAVASIDKKASAAASRRQRVGERALIFTALTASVPLLLFSNSKIAVWMSVVCVGTQFFRLFEGKFSEKRYVEQQMDHRRRAALQRQNAATDMRAASAYPPY